MKKNSMSTIGGMNGKNEVQIFQSKDFGQIRAVEKKLKDTYFGVVYALEYGDKLKIGHSAKPYTRIMTLKRNAEKYGNLTIGRVCLSEPHTNHSEVELFLHHKFESERIDGTELFNVRFDDFVDYFRNEQINFKDETKEIEMRAETFLSGMKSFILGG